MLFKLSTAAPQTRLSFASQSASEMLDLPQESDPESEWSGFLELCPSQSDAKSLDYGLDIFSNLETCTYTQTDRNKLQVNSCAEHMQ